MLYGPVIQAYIAAQDKVKQRKFLKLFYLIQTNFPSATWLTTSIGMSSESNTGANLIFSFYTEKKSCFRSSSYFSWSRRIRVGAAAVGSVQAASELDQHLPELEQELWVLEKQQQSWSIICQSWSSIFQSWRHPWVFNSFTALFIYL